MRNLPARQRSLRTVFDRSWRLLSPQEREVPPLIVQLETAPQALEALAGIAHLQARAGQPEQALALIGLVQHHPSSYQESKDRLADLVAELEARLPSEQVKAALVRGQERELWAMTAELRDSLIEDHDPSRTSGSLGFKSPTAAKMRAPNRSQCSV